MVQRLWPIDVTRGIAVVLMIIYHFLFDLNFLGLSSLDFQLLPLLLFQRLIAFLFLSLVGVSLVLSREKRLDLCQHLKRVALLAAVALLITVSTWIYPHDGFIVFGIIHFIAVAVLLGYFFTKLPAWFNLAAGIACWAVGFWFSSMPPTTSPWLLWLGLPPVGFYSLDYYPLIPWFGIVLFGIFAGKILLSFLKSIADQAMPPMLNVFDTIGKRALTAYVIHQPILFGILLVLKAILGHGV